MYMSPSTLGVNFLFGVHGVDDKHVYTLSNIYDPLDFLFDKLLKFIISVSPG